MKVALYIVGGLALVCVAFLSVASLYLFGENEKQKNAAKTQAARDARWKKPSDEKDEVLTETNQKNEGN